MKKVSLVVLYILFHIFILRDIRTALFSYQVQGLTEARLEQVENLSVIKLDTRLINFEYHTADFNKVWSYKIEFGFFFLLAMIGLIFTGAGKNFYLILIGIHFSTLIFSSLILSFLVYQSVWSLAVCDLLSRYLIPLSSLGMIPLAFIEKRKVKHER